MGAHSTPGSPGPDVELGKRLLQENTLTLENGRPDQTENGYSKRLVDGACICLNIASTVMLVFLNKWYVPQVVALHAHGLAQMNMSDNNNKKDLSRLSAEEYANFICYVAFRMYHHGSMDS